MEVEYGTSNLALNKFYLCVVWESFSEATCIHFVGFMAISRRVSHPFLKQKFSKIWHNCGEQIGNPSEEDLVNWGWHFTTKTLPDEIMKKASGTDVSGICELHAECHREKHLD